MSNRLIQRAIVEKNEPFYPMHIGLLGSVTEVSDPCSMPYLIQQFWLDRHNLYHVYLLQIVVDISWLEKGWISYNIDFMKYYLTPSIKVSTLGNEFDFQSNLQSFYYNVKAFYTAKSHDKTLSRGFYRAKLPYFSFSQAIMHENKSGF